MSREHVTKDGEMLDLVCYRAYAGRQSGPVEAVLEANRGRKLSHEPPSLPRGVAVTLPDLPQQGSRSALVKLWD